MAHPISGAEPVPAPLDRFALDLQRLREKEDVSYSELAARVYELRRSRGIHDAAARIPRSTIYTCFQTGRARINADLLRDIVRVLTGDDLEANAWVERYVEARRSTAELRRAASFAPEVAPDPGPAPTTPDISPDALTDTAAPTLPHTPSLIAVVLVVTACVLLNRAGFAINTALHFGLFLDMIGTCLAAIALGPWLGVAVALGSSGLVFLSYRDPGSLFVLVNVTGALAWGYGVRRFKLGNDFPRFTLLGIGTAFACSAIGVPIGFLLAALDAESSIEGSVRALEDLGLPFAASLYFANITISICDKLLASFIGLGLFVFLHRQYAFPADHMPLARHLGTLRTADISFRLPERVRRR